MRPPPVMQSLFVTLVLGLATAATAEEQVWVGASVWQGAEQGFLDNAVLHVSEGCVVNVFPTDDPPWPDGGSVHDVSGQHLIPGLINARLLSEDSSEDIRNLRLLQTVVVVSQNAVLQ